MQAMLLGAGGAVASKPYVDDVFSTYLWKGNATARSINNGIDLSGEGGMTWIKSRSVVKGHILNDTARGAGNRLGTNDTSASASGTAFLSAFNSNGFSIGTDGDVNENNETFSSWSFRKSKGFFTCLTFTGNGSNRTISHDLGCVPGFYIVKKYNDTSDWICYHKDLGPTKYLDLNTNGAAGTESTYWNDTAPTASVFSIGTSNEVNENGDTFVCYLFAGGESTAATAVSVDFDGNDYLTVASSADLAPGTGDFTWEAWIKPDNWSSTYMPLFVNGSAGGLWIGKLSSNFAVHAYNGTTQLTYATFPPLGQWTHVAVTRSGTTLRLYYNGLEVKSVTSSQDFIQATTYIGNDTSTNYFDGKISNVRFVKGTAVYTTSFRPSITPLTNITNTKLLCCNNSSNTGSTVTPGTITAHGDLVESIDSPFDDPAGFVFGENEDQGVIKCGSYVGNGSTAGPELNLGWEPQWVIIKPEGISQDWYLADVMRGIESGSDVFRLQPSTNAAETEGGNRFDVTSTGLKFNSTDNEVNGNGDKYIYIAIRRPDGYVSKPAEAGTDVFAMDTGNGSTPIPCFDSGFPVDFATLKIFASSGDWYTSARKLQGKYFFTNGNQAQSNSSSMAFDSNAGWANDGTSSSFQSWMWKRHAGFDVVAYTGDGVDGRWIPHSMNSVPEMVWVKRTSHTGQWVVGHKGLDGGTAPWTHYLTLETTAAESDYPLFHDTAPTSTHFKVGGHAEVNGDGKEFLSILFSSVAGISKVGYYAGDGSTDRTITTGFSPRFLMIRCADATDNWLVWDTTRGFASGNDATIFLNTDGAQDSGTDWVDPISTGFEINLGWDAINNTGKNYIYYAHA